MTVWLFIIIGSKAALWVGWWKLWKRRVCRPACISRSRRCGRSVTLSLCSSFLQLMTFEQIKLGILLWPGFGDIGLAIRTTFCPLVCRSLSWRDVPSGNRDSTELTLRSVWRPLVDAVTQWPLALCDNRTVNPRRDLKPFDLVRDDYIGESYVSFYSSHHRWYFIGGQTFQEGWLMKLYDSKYPDTNGKSTLCFPPIYQLKKVH